MALLWLLCAALLDFAAVGRGVTIHHERQAPASEPGQEGHYLQARSPGWIQNVSHVLHVEGIQNPEEQTAVVTFAGKKNVEYMDGAVMLGMSVQKHLPGYPMVALAIIGMRRKFQSLLRNASWSLTFVPNWDWDYCGPDCDSDFLGRWHDSFEKINAFRLPFKRVLFLDSDTYIFSSRIQELVKREMPDDHIALAMDGCKDEFNSGVMLYRPRLSVFKQMLELVSTRKREQILDQNLVNEVYRGRVQEVPREFNCVDTMGVQPGLRRACQTHCSARAVVAHFTGHPKPTAAKRRLLELVRRPGAPAIACTNTNFGSCAKWSEYYCDIRKHFDNVSRDLRRWLNRTGECCHSPFDPSRDAESCKECPSTLSIHSKKPRSYSSRVYGTYVKSSITSEKFHGGKPIFVKWKTLESGPPQYMFYVAKQLLWAIGRNYSTNHGIIAYAQKEAQCPRDAGAWHVYDGAKFIQEPIYLATMPNGHGAPTDTEHVAWNIGEHRWDREHLSAESLDHDDEEESEEDEEEVSTTMSRGFQPGAAPTRGGKSTATAATARTAMPKAAKKDHRTP